MKRSIYSAMETDPQLEREGVTIDMGDLGRFRVARAGGRNQAFNARSAAVLKPYRRMVDQMPIERLRELLVPVYAEHIVKGWEGVTDRNGDEIPYSFENAKRVLSDLPDLFDKLREQAEEMGHFLVEEVEDAVKNS